MYCAPHRILLRPHRRRQLRVEMGARDFRYPALSGRAISAISSDSLETYSGANSYATLWAVAAEEDSRDPTGRDGAMRTGDRRGWPADDEYARRDARVTAMRAIRARVSHVEGTGTLRARRRGTTARTTARSESRHDRSTRPIARPHAPTTRVVVAVAPLTTGATMRSRATRDRQHGPTMRPAARRLTAGTARAPASGIAPRSAARRRARRAIAPRC